MVSEVAMGILFQVYHIRGLYPESSWTWWYQDTYRYTFSLSVRHVCKSGRFSRLGRHLGRLFVLFHCPGLRYSQRLRSVMETFAYSSISQKTGINNDINQVQKWWNVAFILPISSLHITDSRSNRFFILLKPFNSTFSGLPIIVFLKEVFAIFCLNRGYFNIIIGIHLSSTWTIYW